MSEKKEDSSLEKAIITEHPAVQADAQYVFIPLFAS